MRAVYVRQLTNGQSGNIILADADLKILALSRNVAEGEGQEPQKVGLSYSLESRQNFLGIPDISQDRVRNALTTAIEKAAKAKPSSSKAATKQVDVLRKCLAVSITELPPILVDHVLQANNFDTASTLQEVLENDSLLASLTENLQKARDLVDSITSSTTCAGFIFAKKPAQSETSGGKGPGLLYDDFHPFVPTKFEKKPGIEVLRFEGYNQTVDEFYSSLEGQKLENRLMEREAAAQRKLDAAKQDQENRIKGLQNAQSQNFRKAAAIEANIERVQEAMDSVNSLLDQGMDWVDIGKLVEREKKKGNPVANMICLPLNLAENTISVRLSEGDEEEDEDDDPFETDDSEDDSEEELPRQDQKTSDTSLIVEILLTLSPWGNAREYYDQRKTAVVKEEKTQLQADKAIKSTEQKIKHDLKKVLKQEKALLQPIRNLMWFEKFYWFISSDGYLVVGAKDKSQAEILYRRHLRAGDIYCHADAKEASVVVVKNNSDTAGAPIPPATLSQAGQLSICSSEAWDSKAGMGAWWVNANQVSKSAPTGDLLEPGSFNVSGEKNFLPPGQLVLGVSVLFKISEESRNNHTKHRIQDSTEIPGEGAEVKKSLVEDGALASSNANEDDVDEENGNNSDDNDNDDRSNPLQEPNQTGAKAQVEVQEPDGEHVESQMAALEVQDEEDEDEDVAESVAETAHTSTIGSAMGSSAKRNSQADTKQPKRGQRRKAKKIAAKYKDQDEEDRIAAEAIIGAATGKQKIEAEVQAKLQRQEELEQAKARRRAQHERTQKDAAKHEEKRRAILNGIDQDDENEDEKRVPLDLLVGTPRPGDEIIEAVTVCAPWSALGRSKYKVKMQPGPVKKGKAVKELLERWKADAARKGTVDEKSQDTEKMWPREVELIKFLKPEEMVNTVPAGKLRLMVPGATGGGNKGRGSDGGKGSGKGSKKK